MNKKRIVITGGHLAPAMAVIEELQKKDLPAARLPAGQGRQGGWEIYYLGRKYAMEGEKILSEESKIIPNLGVKFIPVAAGRLQRRFTRWTIPSLLRVPVGFFQSLILLWRIKPKVICSFGGYVSVPVVVAGWLLRIPILTHEQTVVFGLASKINSFFANKVAVSFPQSLSYFPKDKVILTGNPLRKEIFEIKKPSWFPNVQSSNYPIIYITGGNQGSHIINMAVTEILTKLLEKYIVIHQTGEKDYQQMANKSQERYLVVPYVGPEEIGWVLNKADLTISRAGANTVCEIAALGKAALFIPIPWSYQDEQTKNAQMLVEIGTAEILPQTELTGASLLNKISQMMLNLDRYQRNASRSKKIIELDAAQKIVEQIYVLEKKD